MTRAFVTGVTGQDGTILARRLVAEGVEVHGLVRDQDDVTASSAERPPEVHVHVADVRDGPGLARILATVAPDEVYNLAGISSVAYSWEHPVTTGEVTGVGAVALFEAAHQVQEATGRQVRVVHASSSEIFGIPDRSPQDEHTAIRPVSPYGAAKAYAHQMAGIYRSRGLAVSSCVLYNHESPLRPMAFVTRKITAGAARIAVSGEGVLSLGNLDARRDWGWAEDYVDAMVRAARHDHPGDFVIASGQTRSVAEFVEAAFARAHIDDWRAHVRVDPQFVRPVDASDVVGDASRAKAELGWQPTIGFEEVVGRMVDHDLALLRA
ncbi:GDP-mannose 4,6-dehydratase [Cellulomonas sp. URHD0024]|uniref:GDP-mannose 4,6-dehydratase n=1 Tax=Cellulomonas sp. URHD0024 TaxID=1302620 RepID=UPI00041F2812|nr:GDP-mannose 4,6-dehydratase [Cellulomonas sp. URHD0024]